MNKLLLLIFLNFVTYTSFSAPTQLPMCATCHGLDGKSSNNEWPNLNAQHATYLLKQLRDFKQGTTRQSNLMTALLASLSDEDLLILSQYYSEQPQSAPSKKTRNKRGEQLYRFVDSKLHIPACGACHGPQGFGNAQAGFPKISGQNKAYTIQQLINFKTHKRFNDLNAIMQTISTRFTQEDLDAIAEYLRDDY